MESIVEIEIQLLTSEDVIPNDLLLLADPSEEMIQTYLPHSLKFIAKINKIVVGIYVLFPISASNVEIKNISVDNAYQRKGIGTILLHHAIVTASEKGYKKILIGTANASIGQLYLYQKLGFEIESIKENFFIDNYNEPIYENGIMCKHMIMLSKTLS